MIKPPDISSIHPVARIMPALAVDSVGSVTQELADRAEQFVKGQEYIAKVLAKVGETTYNVKLESGNLKETLVKMDLGSAAKTGQTIKLRFLHDNPVATFLLATNNGNFPENTTKISKAANLIDYYLKQGEVDGVSTRIQATEVLTHTPKNSTILAHELKNALSSSGLFYESHLNDLVQGNQTLAAIKQEPQNQSNFPIASLITQQLSVLENQRLAWHGEVWPGQKMDWDLSLQEQVPHSNEEPSSEDLENKPISSELTLNLPKLGKVSARIRLVNGHMSINLLVEQLSAIEILKNQKTDLLQAFSNNGQKLDALTVVRHE